MMSLRPVSPGILTAAACCLFALFAVAARQLQSAEPLPQAELDRLTALWETQRKEIQTAKIEADHFELHAMGSVDQQGIDRFIRALETRLQNDAAVADLQAVTKTLPLEPKTKAWGKLLFILDGEAVRTRETWLWDDGSEGVSDVSYDGKVEVQYQSTSRQVNILQGRSKLRMVGLSDLRLVPALGRGTVTVTRDAEPGVLQVSQGDFKMRVYERSGLVRDRDHVLGRRRTLQYQPAQFAGGVVFPRVTVQLRMQADSLRLRSIEIFRIRSADFNVAIQPDEFSVPIPARTRVVDRRPK
jgi:hypothetical protein